MRPQGKREFTCFNPSAGMGGAKEVAVILELAAARDTMEVFSCPVGFLVGAVGCVARSHGWRGAARAVQVLLHLVACHC